MFAKRRLSWAVLFFAVVVNPFLRADSPQALFDRAYFIEVNERDLTAALAHYRLAVPSAPPSLAAQIWERIAECATKLGLFLEAREAYQQLLLLPNLAPEKTQLIQQKLDGTYASTQNAGVTPELKTPPAPFHLHTEVGGYFPLGKEHNAFSVAPNVWLRFGYETSAQLEWGLEASRLYGKGWGFGGDAGDFGVGFDTHVTRWYAGPYLQKALSTAQVNWFAGIGAGIVRTSYDFDLKFSGTFLGIPFSTGYFSSQSTNNVGWTASTGCAWTPRPWLRLQLTLRYLGFMGSQDITLPTQDAFVRFEGKDRVGHALMPTAGLSFLF